MSDEVLVHVVGAVLRVTLNRPRALNALTLAMIDALDAALDLAEREPAVAVVFLEGAGDRGFCAGGDIVMMRNSALAGDTEAVTMWRREYALNARISEFPKPIVAFMDGVVMGGGVGLACHASHRLATERLRCAMPEVGIGFTPDVGGSWLLSRAPGECGTHLALTGTAVGAADAIFLGLADVTVPSTCREAVLDHLADGGETSAIAGLFGVDTGAADLESDRFWIDDCYVGDSAPAIVGRLLGSEATAARNAASAISAKSPTSVSVTLEALRRASKLPTLRDCLAQELTVSTAFLGQSDFVEGIRAQVVDKDRNPAWKPDTLDAVDADSVRAFFG